MAHHGICNIFEEWRAQEAALTSNFSKQETSKRIRMQLNVGAQLRLIKKGANKKVLLGDNYKPKFIYPRGKAWLQVAIRSNL